MLVSNHLAPHTTMCDWSSPCCLAIKITGSAVGQPSDLYILTVYLPPEHSSYLKSTQTDPFAVLNQASSHIPTTSHTLLMGDFNAHTATGATPYVRHDLLPSHHDDATHPHNPHPESPETPALLISMASNSSNYVLTATILFSMAVPRGTPKGSTPMNGALLVVLLTTASPNLPYGHLSVNSKWASTSGHPQFLSDHSIILTELNRYTTPHYAPPPRTTPSPLLKFDWTPEATNRLTAKLREPHTQLQIELLERRLHLPTPNIDGIVISFTELILEAAKQVVRFRRKGPPSKKQKSGRKWYDQSLRSFIKEISKLNPTQRSSPSPHLGEQIRAKRNLYRRLLRSKACQFKQRLQGKTHSTTPKSPTEWWNLLHDLKSNAKWDDPDQYVKLDDLTNL